MREPFRNPEWNNMGKRKMYNTTLDADILREIKILAAQLEMRQNDLIEEAIRDLMKNTSIWNLVYRMGDQFMGPTFVTAL